MQRSRFKSEEIISLKVAHNLQRQILEVLSLFRVMNSYYNKKNEIQNQIRPLIFEKFKEGLQTIKKKKVDWLFSIPVALETLSDDFLSKKDSFRFPDSIILFEAWMNLGLDALFPRVVFHFKFPGLLKGEKIRHVFQFIFSTSRGFGFPIYFYPEFYYYKLKYVKILEPLLKWVYTVCHKANQAILLVNQKLKSKRHHPGEFESVIISECENNVFKGIDTILHGYFTGKAKYLGKFSSLEETLQNLKFSYTIGDHAMRIERWSSENTSDRTLNIPIITHDLIVQKYDIDFYSYIKKLMYVNKLINKKLSFYKKKRKDLLKYLKIFDKVRFYIERAIPRRKLSKKFFEIKKYSYYKKLFEKLRELLWTTPLYTHTIHNPTIKEISYKFTKKSKDFNEYDQESANSILLTTIKQYEKDQNFVFEEKGEEETLIGALKELRDHMAKMWLYFKESQFRYAVKKLNEISILSIDDQNYKNKINDYIDKLIPIFSIYELFHRSLSESVYPELIAQTKRLGSYMARFFNSKFNPIGIKIINLFNKLAFYNWIFLIKRKKLNYRQFFNLILNLPIWKHIPAKIKTKII